ncbi:hypothetical protein [Micromonospora sp. B9E7]|uniref:hypothetical protein n=1 Tax=Micromonospora sp. B9E7 TaxID=3153574 RepID=UPI00325E0F88
MANDEAGSEYAASKFKKPAVYGTARYYYGLEALAYSLKRTADAQVLKLYGRPYAVVNGVLVYPWCFGNSKDLDHREIPIRNASEFKRDLFAARTASRDRAQSWIDFTPNEDSSIGVALRAFVEEGDEVRELRALMVGYASNPQAGLLRVVLGDVELYSDGHLHWNNDEELSIEAALAGDLSITRQDIADSITRFDSLPEPDIDLSLQVDGLAAGSPIEEQPHAKPNGSTEEGNPSTEVS